MMKLMANILLRAFLFIFFIIKLARFEESQKPNFEVAHTAGSMDVLASQFTADVKLKSDTVNVDVKPGDTEFPVQSNLPKIHHIYQYAHPVLGKRSVLFRKQERTGRKR